MDLSPISPITEASGDELARQNLSLSQKAYELIRSRIVSLNLPPGMILDESRLQVELGLGRTPIREALQRLALEKLVMIIPRRGIFVAEISIEDLQQLFEVRIVLEGLAARLAAQRGTASHWKQMQEVIHLLDSNRDVGLNELLTIDESCHQIIYNAANNDLLADSLLNLYALSRRLWIYLNISHEDTCSWLGEHIALLAALKAGDDDSASLLMERHIQSFHKHIRGAVLGAPSPTR